jgi:hypothetical protein
MQEQPSYPPVRVTGLRQLRLVRAFELVRDRLDWTAPIQAVIPASQRRVVQQAVMIFTGSWPEFASVPGDPEHLVVTAPGCSGRSREALIGA